MGGWSSLIAAATVCREQWSCREIAQPESFSIAAKRRISAHKGTFMAWLLSGLDTLIQRPAVRCRRVPSVLDQTHSGGAGRMVAAKAPASGGSHGRSDREPTAHPRL